MHNMDHDVSKSKMISTPNADVSRRRSTPDSAVSKCISTPDSVVTRHSIGSINRTLLTPCRRIGLGRPSTGSLKKSGTYRSPRISNENTPVTPKNITPPMSSNRRLIISPLAARNCEDTLPHKKNEVNSTPVASKINGRTAINCNVNKSNLSKHPGIKRCLRDISESKENKNIHIEEMEAENDDTETMGNDFVDTKSAVIDKGEAESHSEQTCLQESNDKKQKLEVTNTTLAEIAERIIKKKKRLEDLKIQEIYAKKNDLNTLRELTKKWRKAGQEALCRMLKMARDMGYKVTLLELIQQYNFPLELIKYSTKLEDFEYDDI